MERIAKSNIPAHALAFAAIVSVALSASGCGVRSLPDDPDQEEGDTVPIPELSPAEKAELEKFRAPEATPAVESLALSKYRHLDPKGEVPPDLLKKAVSYFDLNKDNLKNTAYLTVVDFSKRSSRSRMFIIDMASGAVERLYVAHGRKSDPDNDGYATSFSNVVNSNKSSIGFYRTAETYYGKHGLSLRLDGLSSTNSNVRVRAVVVHSASYVRDSAVKQGRSNGCLAISEANKTRVIERLKEGSLIYADLAK